MIALRVIGHLSRGGRFYAGADGTAYVEVMLGQAGNAGDVIGRMRVGIGHSAQYIARNKARRLRKGAMVTVYAKGFEIDRTDGVLKLHGVDRIDNNNEAPVFTGGQPEKEVSADPT